MEPPTQPPPDPYGYPQMSMSQFPMQYQYPQQPQYPTMPQPYADSSSSTWNKQPMPSPPPAPDYGNPPVMTTPIPVQYQQQCMPPSLQQYTIFPQPPQQYSSYTAATTSLCYQLSKSSPPTYVQQQYQTAPYVFDEMHVRGMRSQMEVENEVKEGTADSPTSELEVEAVGEEPVVPEKIDVVADVRGDEVEDNISDTPRDGSIVRYGSDSVTLENTRVVIEHGVVPKFVELLGSPSDDVREQVVWALENIAGNSPNCGDLVITQGALAPLLAQLKEHLKLLMARNTWTLSNFCRRKPFAPFEQTKPALQVLNYLLNSVDEEVLTDACWTLSYLPDGKIVATICGSTLQWLCAKTWREIVAPLMRKRQYSVVMFDEVEKAHVAIFNTLLQVLNDGRLTDGQGRTVDFRNTVIIMTLKIGAGHLLAGMVEKSYIQIARDRVMQEVRRHFRPEMLNTLDEIVIFDPFSHEQLQKVAKLQMRDVAAQLAERVVALVVSDSALDVVLTKSYEPSYGARPIRRWLEKLVTTIWDPGTPYQKSGQVFQVSSVNSLKLHYRVSSLHNFSISSNDSLVPDEQGLVRYTTYHIIDLHVYEDEDNMSLDYCESDEFKRKLMVIIKKPYDQEKSTEVLGSILEAPKAIVNVIDMTKMIPPIKDMLPRLTPILIWDPGVKETVKITNFSYFKTVYANDVLITNLEPYQKEGDNGGRNKSSYYNGNLTGKGPINASKFLGGFDSFLGQWQVENELYFYVHYPKKSRQYLPIIFEVFGLAVCWKSSPFYYVNIMKDLTWFGKPYTCPDVPQNSIAATEEVALLKAELKTSATTLVFLEAKEERANEIDARAYGNYSQSTDVHRRDGHSSLNKDDKPKCSVDVEAVDSDSFHVMVWDPGIKFCSSQ